MPTLRSPELPLFALALAALVGCVLLLALGKTVPEFLQTTVLATVVGGAGIATPRQSAQAPAQASAAVVVADGLPQ